MSNTLTMTAEALHSKQLGAMIGGALGDAAGELASRTLERGALLAEFERAPQLRYSDNTTLTLAVAETLVETGGIDPQILGHRFQEYYHKEPLRGYGESLRAIQALVSREGIGFFDAAARLYDGAGSYGNGAAARVTPVVLFYDGTDRLAEGIVTASRVTHAHPIALDGAAVMAEAQMLALEARPQRPFSPQGFLERLVETARTPEMRAQLELLGTIVDAGGEPADAARHLGLSTSAHESVPFALYSFLTHPHEFIECILTAVLQGGDRHSMGTMAGSLSGALLGTDAIPAGWRARLENTQRIESITHELVVKGSSARLE